MTFRQFKTEEIALLLHGLRAVSVLDQRKLQDKLEAALEAELSARGVRLAA